MIIRLLFMFLLACSLELSAQDTAFLSRHIFPSAVRNVFKAKNELYVKTADGVYKKELSGWEKQDLAFKKPYVFFETSFYEADYLPNKYIFDPLPMRDLIPNRSLTNATVAEMGDHFFVSVAGALYEYTVTKLYRHTFKGMSVRDIYQIPGFKVVSTYSGIFLNDTVKADQPGHSNGPLCRIGNRYFLCSDHLYVYDTAKGFQLIPSGDNLFAGYSRKLIEFNRNVYSMNTKSVNLMDSNFQLRPIHQGYEYYDIEAEGGKLVFSTRTGEVFQYDGKSVTQLCKLGSRIRDIYLDNNIIYLSSDEGVFTFPVGHPDKLAPLAKTPFSVMTLVDPQRNTWISTENGLFLLPEKAKTPIPFIPGVEFNRGALSFYNDSIYAGSIEGLFVIDTYNVVKNFLPSYLNQQIKQNRSQNLTYAIYLTAIVLVISILVFVIRRHGKKRFKVIIMQKADESNSLSLAKIAEDIKLHNIQTVEALAEHYSTNAVQLNRIFKTFETTPGKFMKKVKLDLARELLEDKVSLDEVVARVGYSAIFLKKELHL